MRSLEGDTTKLLTIEPDRKVLRDIESKLAGAVEGTVGRLFRSSLTPAEIVRGLAREMDNSRVVVRDRTWVSSDFEIFLNPDDAERLQINGVDLADELAAGLLLHAREQRYALSSTPSLSFSIAPELAGGKFGIAVGEASSMPSPASERPSPDHREAEQELRQAERSPAAVSGVHDSTEGSRTVTIHIPGRSEVLPVTGAVVGRSRSCDIVIASEEVSRRHCRIAPGPRFWFIEDLGSTNGVLLNGKRIEEPEQLRDGDLVLLGAITVSVQMS